MQVFLCVFLTHGVLLARFSRYDKCVVQREVKEKHIDLRISLGYYADVKSKIMQTYS
jgi:hypothetical protein